MYKQNKKTKKWLSTAYPKDAREATDSWIEATEFSLNKYKQATPEVLEKYDLIQVGNAIFTSNPYTSKTTRFVLAFDATTCPLCIRAKEVAGNDYDFCEICPLYKELDDVKCDRPGVGPWYRWVYGEGPESMIDALQRTLDRLKEEQDEQ